MTLGTLRVVAYTGKNSSIGAAVELCVILINGGVTNRIGDGMEVACHFLKEITFNLAS